MQLITDKATEGAHVRLAFADPDCPHVAERDALETDRRHPTRPDP
jgi:hypothetical protein